MERIRAFVGSQVSEWHGIEKIKRNYPLGSIFNPAINGIQLYDAGYRVNDLYYITTSQGSKQVYVDLNTVDATTGKAGWMLVASWATASSWTYSASTTNSILGITAVNGFSSNFGTMSTNFMRMTVSSSLLNLGTNATSADFYFYSSSSAPWREWWVTDSSNNIRWSTTVNAGQSLPREAIRQFTHAHNIKFNYTATTQVWNNLSDGVASPIAGRQGDWWNGLNGTTTSIGWYGASDGSLAIIPQGDTSTGAGQDCNYNQTKIGWDDGVQAAWYGTSATNNMNSNTGTQGTNTNLWIWIK
jgi:hypothetical protein